MKTIVLTAVAGAFLLGLGGSRLLQSDTITEVSHSGYKVGILPPSPPESSDQKKKVENLTLKEEDTVFLVGEIGANAVGVAQEITRKARNNKALYLVINSPGGSVLDGALIVSAIQASKVPVYTICAQLCASMAAITFEMGTKRYMVDRSILMFHDAAGGVQGTFPQIKSRFTFFSSYVLKMDNEIARRAGLTLQQFLSKLNPECWRDAEDAYAEHFSDGYANLYFSGVKQSEDPSMSQTRTLKSKFDVQLGN